MPDINLRKHRGVYAAVWYEGGHRQRRSLGTSDRSVANTRLIALKAQLAAAAPSGPLTVRAICQAYIDDRKEDGKPVERIEYAFKRTDPHFGDHRPCDVTKAVCNSYIAKRRKDGVGDGTIWTEMTILRTALAFAVKKDWITKAPYINVPQKPGPRDHRLTREEVQRLLDAAVVPHVKLFIRLALSTAGRMSALLELTWVRTDLDARRIYLRDPDRAATNKGRATLPINDTLHAALLEARTAAQSPFVIEWAGTNVVSVKKGVSEAARRAGVKCSPHVLRHTAACLMAEEGVAMEVIAQYLGHRDVATTRRIYARYSPEFLREAAAALEF